MPSRDDGPFPCFRRQRSAAVRHMAVLAAFALLPAGCDDDTTVVPERVASQADAGTSALPDGASDMPADAGSGSSPLPPEAPPPGAPSAPEVVDGGWSDSDVLALGVQDLLQSWCGGCHSEGGVAPFSGGLDLSSLIESGLIVPGTSASSPLLERIVDGSMPPATSFGYTIVVGDVALLADFIDQLPAESPPRCEPPPFVALDDVYATLLADVRSRPAEDRRYVRYVSVADTSNARLCGAALEQRRQALFKLVNSLSMATEIDSPVAIDAAALLYRIDLRAYAWAREIDLDADGNVDFPDGWEAMLRAVPHEVSFSGPEASALSTETGAAVPLASLSGLIRAGSDSEVYRALLGLPANVYDMQLELGLDTVAELEDATMQRAGFVRHSSRTEVITSRYSLGDTGTRALWTLEVDDNWDDSGSIYADPLDTIWAPWTQTIWELPNGLQGYLVSDAAGTVTTGAPTDCVGTTCVRLGQQRHAVTCWGCHADGLRPVRDTIRAYVQDFPREFDSQYASDVLAIFVPAAELDQTIENDNVRYRAALARLGIQPGMPDPISRVYLDYDRPLDLERAAAELAVPADVLSHHLGALPALAPLGDPSGTVERSVFDAAHLEALCAVHATSRNRPTACP